MQPEQVLQDAGLIIRCARHFVQAVLIKSAHKALLSVESEAKRFAQRQVTIRRVHSFPPQKTDSRAGDHRPSERQHETLHIARRPQLTIRTLENKCGCGEALRRDEEMLAAIEQADVQKALVENLAANGAGMGSFSDLADESPGLQGDPSRLVLLPHCGLTHSGGNLRTAKATFCGAGVMPVSHQHHPQ